MSPGGPAIHSGSVGFPSPGYPWFWLYLRVGEGHQPSTDFMCSFHSAYLPVSPPFRRMRRNKKQKPDPNRRLSPGVATLAWCLFESGFLVPRTFGPGSARYPLFSCQKSVYLRGELLFAQSGRMQCAPTALLPAVFPQTFRSCRYHPG